jgi:hypothetical protein
VRHMKKEHSGWKDELLGKLFIISASYLVMSLSVGSTDFFGSLLIVIFFLGPQIESIPSSSQNSSQNPGLESSGQTPNSRPMWMDELKRDFQPIIVDKCSEQTRNAIANDEDIKVS